MKEIEKMNIFEKMLMVTKEVASVAKDIEVGYGKNKYKAVSEANILSAVKPIEEKYKIYSFPLSRKIIKSEWVETTSSKLQFITIKVVYRFVNIDNTEQFVDIESCGDGADSLDKACGKAMTYADKYALMKAYKIQTGEDPDYYESKQLKTETKIVDKQTKENFVWNSGRYEGLTMKESLLKNDFEEYENALRDIGRFSKEMEEAKKKVLEENQINYYIDDKNNKQKFYKVAEVEV